MPILRMLLTSAPWWARWAAPWAQRREFSFRNRPSWLELNNVMRPLGRSGRPRRRLLNNGILAHPLTDDRRQAYCPRAGKCDAPRLSMVYFNVVPSGSRANTAYCAVYLSTFVLLQASLLFSNLHPPSNTPPVPLASEDLDPLQARILYLPSLGQVDWTFLPPTFAAASSLPRQPVEPREFDHSPYLPFALQKQSI